MRPGVHEPPPPRKFIELYRDLMPDDERAGRHAIEWIA